MSILPIRLFPDPVLRNKAEPVVVFDDALSQLVADMTETMYAAPGIGLAAPQVGVKLRLAVVDLSVGEETEQLLVLVNPRIETSEEFDADSEGCLSIPELTEKVERPAMLRLFAQNTIGQPYELEANGLLARAIQHEIDHLDGILFVDRLHGLRRQRAKRHLRRLEEAELAAVEPQL